MILCVSHPVSCGRRPVRGDLASGSVVPRRGAAAGNRALPAVLIGVCGGEVRGEGAGHSEFGPSHRTVECDIAELTPDGLLATILRRYLMLLLFRVPSHPHVSLNTHSVCLVRLPSRNLCIFSFSSAHGASQQDEGLWDDGSVTLAQLNKAEMNEILSKAQGMSTSQLRSEINKLEGASSRTTSLASAARTQSLGGIVRGGQITEVRRRGEGRSSCPARYVEQHTCCRVCREDTADSCGSWRWRVWLRCRAVAAWAAQLST